MAFGLDWVRPPRQMIQTAYWYMHTDQYRYDHYTADTMAGPTGTGLFDGMSTADQLALSTAPAGCRPTRRSTATRSTSPTRPRRRGSPSATTSSSSWKSGDLHFAVEDPDAPENWPRVLMMWRANLFGSAKGNEYFLKHLLGTDSSVSASETAPRAPARRTCSGRRRRPRATPDPLCTLDFRMTSSTIFSDVAPAATWYEKHDINTTDMHPFIHSFNPAISPPWQTKTDWDIFQAISEAFSPLGAKHSGVRKDVVAAPCCTTPPRPWPRRTAACWTGRRASASRSRARPCRSWSWWATTRHLRQDGRLGPLMEKLGTTQKGITYNVEREVDYLRHKNGAIRRHGRRPAVAQEGHPRR